MTRLFLVALLAGAAVTGTARAQSYDQPGDGQSGYGQPGYGQRPMPSYQDGEAAQPGGTDDSYGSADARTDDGYRRGYGQPALPPGTTQPPSGGYADSQSDDRPADRRQVMRDARYARSHYAERIARWRARADACEAGDLRACQGPE